MLFRKKSILSKIPLIKVRTAVENLNIYMLGLFDNTMYELTELNSGQYYPPHIHKKSNAILHVIFGTGQVIINNKKNNYQNGNTFVINKGVSHGFIVKDQTLLLSINSPPILDLTKNHLDVKYIGGKNGRRI